ncbi:MAG: response regulator [Planctomycetes bacterium]|nr:response regulator [Planctomycetota bacterium]
MKSSSACDPGTVKLLVIDDDPIDRKTYARLLRRKGYVILEAESADEGLRIFESMAPQCVLLDHRLPDMDGPDVLRRILERSPFATVVMITATDRTDLAVDAMKAGAADYLLKDQVDEELLHRTLQSAMGRARLEQELELRHHELRQARDHALREARAKSAFLANMSHEIRTPMTSILGYTDLLLDELKESGAPEHVRALEALHRNGHHLLALINDILDLSKIEAGQMTVEIVDTDVISMIRHVEDMFTARAKAKGIDLRVELDPSLPRRISSDPVRVQQILLNLISNAIKFTREGSVEIDVAWRRDSVHELPRVVFTVRDTGIGMTPEQLGRVFDPFVQADDSTTRHFGGTGLGLSITQSLVRLLGGTIDVQSRVGQGSSFTVTVPDRSKVSLVAASSETNRPADKGEKKLRGFHVLLAEDSDDVARLVEHYLRREGARVTRVDNGVDAVRCAGHDDTDYDVVLMDISMPLMDGYDAAREIRERGFEGLVIALTAHALEGAREKCLAAGCSGYLPKPVERDRLIETILEGRRELA